MTFYLFNSLSNLKSISMHVPQGGWHTNRSIPFFLSVSQSKAAKRASCDIKRKKSLLSQSNHSHIASLILSEKLISFWRTENHSNESTNQPAGQSFFQSRNLFKLKLLFYVTSTKWIHKLTYKGIKLYPSIVYFPSWPDNCKRDRECEVRKYQEGRTSKDEV